MTALLTTENGSTFRMVSCNLSQGTSTSYFIVGMNFLAMPLIATVLISMKSVLFFQFAEFVSNQVTAVNPKILRNRQKKVYI